MIDGIYVEDFETFLEWWRLLSPEPIDMHEAMTIYFNLEIYGE